MADNPGLLQNTKLHLVNDIDTAYEFKRWMSNKTRIALDSETTGLDVHRDQVRLVQFGDKHEGWAIPWQRWGGVIEEIITRYDGEYVLHNMPYDWQILKQSCGIELPQSKCHDTRIAAHILHPDHSTALKNLASYYVDAKAASLSKGLDEIFKQRGGWTWATVPVDFEPYWAYGALDTVLTAHLDEILIPEVMHEAPLAYDLERAVVWVAVDMMQRGVRIDREFTQRKYNEFTRYVETTGEWIIQNYGVKPGANADVIRKLSEYGYEFTKATKAGAVSLDKEVLGSIPHPLAQAVLGRRQVQKIASTYLKNFLELADENDLLHPNINTLGFRQERSSESSYGVRTGRMSMDRVNMQNLSRFVPGAQIPSNTVRECIVSRLNHTLLMVDFDQIEARTIAHLTEDPGFIAAFMTGEDFFNVLASNVYATPITKADSRRQRLKNGVYARAYGAGIPKFAVTTGITEQEAAQVYHRLDELYPGWQVFTRNVDRVARERLMNEGVAYVRSPLTRRKHVADESKIYVLMNFLIQGTASEVFKMKLVEMAQAGLDEFMVLPVHDEVILDVPDDVLKDATRTTLQIMNDPDLFKVPLTASASIGKSWGGKVEL